MSENALAFHRRGISVGWVSMARIRLHSYYAGPPPYQE